MTLAEIWGWLCSHFSTERLLDIYTPDRFKEDCSAVKFDRLKDISSSLPVLDLHRVDYNYLTSGVYVDVHSGRLMLLVMLPDITDDTVLIYDTDTRAMAYSYNRDAKALVPNDTWPNLSALDRVDVLSAIDYSDTVLECYYQMCRR